MSVATTSEAGDTLVEVLIAIVVIGIVSVGSFFSISMGATTSKGQRDFVTADTVLRNYAEALKQGARLSCSTAAGSPSTFMPSYPQSYDTAVGAQGLKLPSTLVTAGWSISTVASIAPTTALTCPPVTATNPLNDLNSFAITVSIPGGATRVLTVYVRTK